jgi:hypothetical protein
MRRKIAEIFLTKRDYSTEEFTFFRDLLPKEQEILLIFLINENMADINSIRSKLP